jgi:hypothetical protein
MSRRGLSVRFLIGASRTLGGFWNGLSPLFRLARQLHKPLKRRPHQALKLIRLKIRHLIGRQILPPVNQPFTRKARDSRESKFSWRCSCSPRYGATLCCASLGAGPPPCLARAKEKAASRRPLTLAISQWSDLEGPALCSAAERRVTEAGKANQHHRPG